MRTRRRAARRRHRGGWIIAAAAAVLALFLEWGVPGLILAAIGAGTFFLLRHLHRVNQANNAALAAASRRAAPRRRAATARPVTRPRPRTAPGDARARRNGWAPPAAASMRALEVSEECADGACVLCPGAGCACICGHDPKVIGAMNTARAAASEPEPAPPIAEDTTPIPY
jgi:hypothetical protein